MMVIKNRLAVTIITLLVLLLAGSIVNSTAFAAEVAGRVANLSGLLFGQKANGIVKTLELNSDVEVGDILVTEKRTYARIKFIDNSEVILRPNTRFTVEAMIFDQERPGADKAVFNLVKGGLRAITGQIGKRGNPDSYRMKTVAATIGIRGTIYEVRICNGNCGPLPDGVYLHALQDAIVVANPAGTLTVGPGQYTYVRDNTTAPVLLPEPPGIDFSLPGWVTESSDTPIIWTGNGEACLGCEVR
ncbi:MAG: FecR family protein [Desulfobacterales bacterium]|nr:FecR family protein [Desulfobacterales bacterium]